MWKSIAATCVLCLVWGVGCADVKLDASNLFDGSADNTAKPAPDPALDFRSPQQLAKENEQLRQQAAPLEKNNQNWTVAIKQRQQELRDLKHQKDDLKKQRDYYKKAAKMD
jgi:hypothetical protein